MLAIRNEVKFGRRFYLLIIKQKDVNINIRRYKYAYKIIRQNGK